MAALSHTHRLLIAHAAKVTTHEGWFCEHDFNGRMRKPLDTLAKRGALECRKVNRTGIVNDCWPTSWYRIPRATA